jgi:hypothetical protein
MLTIMGFTHPLHDRQLSGPGCEGRAISPVDFVVLKGNCYLLASIKLDRKQVECFSQNQH